MSLLLARLASLGNNSAHIGCLEIHVDSMPIVDGMKVCIGVLASTLKVLAAHEAGIDVDVREGHAAELLEIEVQNASIDLYVTGPWSRCKSGMTLEMLLLICSEGTHSIKIQVF